MAEHNVLPFDQIHKAKIDSGLEADMPLAPEGLGDMYWATDTETMWMTNETGDDWVAFEATVTSLELGELADVTITGEAKGHLLVYTGTVWSNFPVASNGSMILTDSTMPYGIKYVAHVLDSLTDVDVTGVTVGSLLVRNSSAGWSILNQGATPDGKVLTARTSDLNFDTVWDYPVDEEARIMAILGW